MSFTTCKFTDVEVFQARVQYSTCFNITFPMTVNLLVHNLSPMEFFFCVCVWGGGGSSNRSRGSGSLYLRKISFTAINQL